MLMLRIVAFALASVTAAAQTPGMIAGYNAVTNVNSYLNRDLVQQQLESLMQPETCPALVDGENFYLSDPVGVYLQSIPTYGNVFPEVQSAEYREYFIWAGGGNNGANFHKQWVTAAFNKVVVARGGMVADFTVFPNDYFPSGQCVGFVESVKKATSYVYNFIEVVQLMQASIESARSGCIYQQSNCLTTLEFWDASAAIYIGSLEGQKGNPGGNGNTNYALANKRCRNYKNCGPERNEGNSRLRVSPVNTQILAYFSAGQHAAFAGDWALMEDYKKLISAKMVVPWIQGTLRYAWRLSTEATRAGDAITSSTNPLDANGIEVIDPDLISGPVAITDYSINDKEVGEAAAFALGSVPKLWACSKKAGELVWPQLAPGQGTAGVAPVNFQLVKLAFECNYKCLMTSCTEVGSLYDGVDKDGLILPGDSDDTIDDKVDIRNGAKTCNDVQFGTDPAGYSKCKKIKKNIRRGKCRFLLGSPGIPKRDKPEYFKKTIP